MVSSDPEFIERQIELFEAVQPRIGSIPLDLQGGPYDGVVLWLTAGELLSLIRDDRRVCLKTSDGLRRTAAYLIKSSGVIAEGCVAGFSGYADFISP